MASWLINFQKMYWELDQAAYTMVDELLTFTMEDFERYEHDLCKRQVADPNFQAISRAPSDLMQDFNKGVHRDPSSFPTMKNIKHWDNWQHVFTATAEAQGVSNVLDLWYIPATTAEAQLFDAHQTYLYAVLLQTVKDSSLEAIVINYMNQQVKDIWHDITNTAEASTSAEIKANSLLQFIITSVNFDDGKWRGMSKDFIVHWCEQLHQYNTLCGKAGANCSSVSRSCQGPDVTEYH